jgi:hypothetical protein
MKSVLVLIKAGVTGGNYVLCLKVAISHWKHFVMKMDQCPFPKFALKTVFTAGRIYLVCVCVCVFVHGRNLEEQGGLQMALLYFYDWRIFFGCWVGNGK